MTREESIGLADRLSEDYSLIRSLDKNIDDLEKQIAVPADIDRQHFSLFTYFKKYFIGSLITLGAMSVFAYFWISIFNFLIASGDESYKNYPLYIILIVVFVFALIHFVGGFKARKKLEEMNKLEEERIYAKRMEKKEQKATLEKLRAQRLECTEELQSYEDIIPAPLRNRLDMENIKHMLMINKAWTFEEAVRLYTK